MNVTAENENRFLAIDFGLKRIGLALSDPLKLFSYPFSTLTNDNNLWVNLDKIIKEKKVSQIILGYPLKENGEATSLTEKISKFKKEIDKKFNIPIILWDESYSSQTAKEKIIQSVTSKKKRRDKGLIDKNAAAVILQEYIDSLAK
jgi:putative Holliday junction resolvase